LRTLISFLIACFFFSLSAFAQQTSPQTLSGQIPAQTPQTSPPAQANAPPPIPASSQANPAPQASPAGTKAALSPAVDHRIWLDVVVTDKDGNAQSGLQQQDFTVLDDKLPLNIASFHAVDGNAEPLKVILVLDAVNAGVQTVNFERQELEKFLRQDGGQLALPTSLVFFTDTSTEVQPATTRDGNSLADLLKSKETGLRVIDRAQGMYGAVDRLDLSLTALKRLTAYEVNQPGRKLLIWFSPGWPLLSGPGIELTKKNQEWLFDNIVGLSGELRRARMTLYSVDPGGAAEAASFRAFYYKEFLNGARSEEKVQAGDLALPVLATQSGGKVMNSSNDLAHLIASCLADAKAYYTLAFEYPPADHPNEYHAVDVKVDKPGLNARTRTGYYAQPYKAGR